MKLIKNIKAGKTRNLSLIFFSIFLFLNLSIVKILAKESVKFVEIKVLDKVSSKTKLIKLRISEEKKYQNLLIKSLKCKNSEFDDNPETTAYLQVSDLTNKKNDQVFIFNGWTFASSPSLRPFDHPIYDIWLIKCY